MPVPPQSGLTRRPVARAPMMPPMQWTPKTSRLSSYPSALLIAEQKTKQTGLTTRPSTIEPITPEKPQAGVIATRPATTPDARPSADGFPLAIHSTIIPETAAEAVASKVLINPCPAKPLASRPEPTLKPNQPTHSS